MAAVWRDETSGLPAVRFAYNPDTVDKLKTGIPRGSRRWDPDRRLWLADPPHEATVRRIPGIPPAEPKHHTKPPAGIDAAVDAFFAALPDHLREPTFKALIRVFHPDVGGDTRAAQALNRWRQERAS